MAANTDSPLERRLRSQIKNDVVRFKSVMRRLFDAQISLEPYLRNVLDAKPEDTRAYELHAETAECLFGMAKALALSQGIVLSLGPFGHKSALLQSHVQPGTDLTCQGSGKNQSNSIHLVSRRTKKQTYCSRTNTLVGSGYLYTQNGTERSNNIESICTKKLRS